MKNNTSKKLFNVALASAMVAGSVVAIAPTATEAANVSFKDLDSSNSHYTTIMQLVERGIVKGYEDNTFKPGQAVNRAHAALILANILDLDTENVTDPKFKDVPKTHPYYGSIAALANAGIIKGFEDGTFGTTKTLSRGQMAVIIKNSFELEAGNATTPFKDILNHDYKEQITALYANGVTVGTTPTTYGAASKVTRGQFATFVVRAEEAREKNAVEAFVEIKDGQIVTTKGTYAIEGDLAKVFNAANAAALKGAKIDFKFAEQTAALASLERVAATPTSKRILGIASLTLVAGNATFDAGGYSIPEVTISGNNVKVNNVKADKLTIADKLTVSLTGVEAKEVAVSATTKLTLDATSSIGKLVLPEGKDVKEVISNYEQVKDQIKELVTKDANGNEKPFEPTPETPNPGVPGLPPSTDTINAESAKTDATSLVNALYNGFGQTYTNIAVITPGTPTVKKADGTVATNGSNTSVDFKDPIVINDDSKSQVDTKLATIKNSISRDVLKENVLSKVAATMLSLTEANINNIDSVYVGNVKLNSANITKDNYYTELSSSLTTNVVADTLSEITGLTHAIAGDLSVADYFAGSFAKSATLKVTFDDSSSLEYAITIQP
ncbi:S-layer homology domain-containing protein [Ureibacillus chungkukjangi]|uniref:S-layer family protein n=1 Tax=Ureibacillus chungkukjangi TaxID=1202712 RepID=A0A318TEE9_9BACL|nr:S-layer homology domain-containing protein [Ureibacillus chungkukjangi]PYF03271.1 S-layer family protein [Ureibacillus chungkukjangi]